MCNPSFSDHWVRLGGRSLREEEFLRFKKKGGEERIIQTVEYQDDSARLEDYSPPHAAAYS